MRRITFFKTMLHAIVMMVVSGNVWGQTTYYWPGSGTWDTTNAWATTSGGAVSTTWVSGSIAQFDASGSITGPTASTDIYDIIANQDIIVTGSSKLIGTPTGHKIASITVVDGKTFDFGNQAFSTASGTGFVKKGAGNLKFGSSGGGTYPGGFTLNQGKVILGGAVNSFGTGILTLNGGTISASATHTFSDSKLNSIIIGGDFNIGDATNFSNISFGTTSGTSTTMSLGNSSTRTINLSGTGIYTFCPIISGIGSNLIINATAAGTLVFGGTSTYDGITTINGGTLKLNATGGALKSGNEVIIGGGLLEITQSQTIGNLTMTSGTLKVNSGQTLTITGTYNVSGGIINNMGTIVLQGSALQTFPGSAATINNGTEGLMTALTVNNSVGVLIDNSFTATTVTIKPGSKLTLNTGKTLTVTNFTINSDSTGTGTLLDNGTLTVNGTTNVQQYLTNGRNWYISSPVATAARSVVSNASNVYSFNEVAGTWTTEIPGATLTPLKGFVAEVTSTGTVNFTGGDLNTGPISNAITFTALSATTGTYRGFNLIGNPYPSYVNWAMATKTELEPSIWYRTLNNAPTPAYVFDTYNATGEGIGTDNNGTAVTRYIAPMQAVWVRVNTDKTGVLGFDNGMRSHQDQTIATNRLKAPAISSQQVLRLQVSNGINSDQAIVLFNTNASDGYDAYDSPKMSNKNVAIPEIYTIVGSENLVINGLNSVSTNQALTLGFNTGASNTFTIKATEISNFDADTRIILKDNLLGTENELAIGTDYSFTSDVTTTASRFSVLFKSASVTTGVNSNANDHLTINIFKNANGQIMINRNDALGQEGLITLCNAVGQKLVNTQTTGTSTVINKSFSSGVYLVTLNIAGKSITKKVIIN